MSLARPQLVAHRGASESEPEHTLAAYRQAIRAGADALECDVRLTADQHLVCVHDRHVDRTSDGQGLVSTLELAQLEGLDWGSWKLLAGNRDWAEVPDVVERSDRAHLLTLRRLCTEVAAAGRRVELAVETKHPTRWGGLVERRLVQLLREFGWTGGGTPVRVMSFSSLALRRMHQLAPEVPLVYLIERRIPLPVLDSSLPASTAVGVDIGIVREHPHYTAKLAARRPLHVWTVDDPDDVQCCLDLGAEAIITNRPAVLRRLVPSRV